MILTRGKFFGKPVVLACDGKCQKAFGYTLRPHIRWTADPDDITWLADDEIPFDAPEDPGTAEGGDRKPKTVPDKHNKWCARACERCEMFGQDEEKITLRGWAKRAHNKPAQRREVGE